MGSGKSTLGKKLANKLEKPFYDLDAEIEKSEKQTINQIFEQFGEVHFRALESKVLEALILDQDGFVLALGGGTPCVQSNMDLINKNGVSIYLKYNPGILTARLMNAKSTRPLIKGLDKDQLGAFVQDKLKVRNLFYDQSNIIIEKNNVSVQDLIEGLNSI